MSVKQTCCTISQFQSTLQQSAPRISRKVPQLLRHEMCSGSEHVEQNIWVCVYAGDEYTRNNLDSFVFS